MELKYVIAGAGATGGSIGAFLAADGRNVTFLARGAQLEAFLEKGISMRGTVKGDFTVAPVKAMTMEAYHEQPDVIFVCVKSYSLEDVIELVKRTGSSKTVVIPILNIYGTGERMQKELPGVTVTDGCIHVAAYVSAPGEITHGGDIFRVVYGLRPGQKMSDAVMEKLSQIKRDCDHAGISGEYTDHVRRDTFQKFMYTSPMAAAGEYYHAQAGDFQKAGKPRETFIAMDRELLELSKAMGLDVPENMVETNLSILAGLSPESGTSMQRDIAQGRQSEISELVYAVEDMAAANGVEMPVYHRVIEELKARGL